MSILTATLASLTRWLGANPATQQDVVYSEASAKRALSRRAFLRTAGAVAAGVVLADQAAEALDPLDGDEYRLRTYPLLVNRAPSSLTTYDAYLKKLYYQSGAFDRLVYPDQPLLRMIVKQPQPGPTASDYTFLPGNARIAEWEKFYTDLAEETVTAVTAIGDSAPAPARPSLFADRFGVTLVRDGNV